MRRDRGGLRAIGLSAALLAGVAQAQTIAIVGGRVLPVSGPPIDGGTVIIRDGRITAVGRDITIPDGAQRIDATGKWVTPGIINPATQLGLVEVGQVRETRNATARACNAKKKSSMQLSHVQIVNKDY